ncbi:hypothetical protein TEA_011153 [Camellia sinensis var. sinensis]|uniref:Dof zinc finger protein n=1 Tax=Camellia sinensis var. sinensis TaxID=542762 RepID=A0A4S4EKR0_CAMSN|nr:hypothetical protein TEA_011153 [Camellia sinensis var. sinensis]
MYLMQQICTFSSFGLVWTSDSTQSSGQGHYFDTDRGAVVPFFGGGPDLVSGLEQANVLGFELGLVDHAYKSGRVLKQMTQVQTQDPELDSDPGPINQQCKQSCMMSAENISAKQTSKDESQSSSSRKTTSMRPPEQALKCPRCDSPNTKFCYYNNYSLTQPRHFCKTCRRYWTKGGALRNVPIGGGCRKSKKIKSSSRLSGDSKDSGGSSDIGGLKFFHGLSPPAMDFQLGCAAACFGMDTLGNSNPLMGMGLNFPLSSVLKQGESGGFGMGVQELGSMNVHSNIASSIESLSSINQDLHWKLQQQRLAMLFGGENQKESSVSSVPLEIENQTQKPQPIMFQNLEISKPEVCAVGNNSRKDSATEWFFDSSYAPVNPIPINSTTYNGNETTSNWNGIQAWTDLNQYSALPYGKVAALVERLLLWWNGAKVRKSNKVLWRSIPLATLRSIWKLRNECKFNNSNPCLDEVIGLVKTRVALWAKTSPKLA